MTSMDPLGPLYQCFSTFGASSPGKRKILKLLSRSKNLLSLSPNNICLSGCSTFLVKRQMELSRKVEMWNNLVNISVTQID